MDGQPKQINLDQFQYCVRLMTGIDFGQNVIVFNQQDFELLQILVTETRNNPSKLESTHLEVMGNQKNQARVLEFISLVNKYRMNDAFNNISIQMNGMHRCPVTYKSLLTNLRIKNLKITDLVKGFQNFSPDMQTDSIRSFTFVTSACPNLEDLNLWRLHNLEQLKISVIPRYRSMHVIDILEKVGKLKVEYSEILLKDVNHFELVIPKTILQDTYDLDAVKTVHNQRGNSLQEIFTQQEIEFVETHQKVIQAGGIDFHLHKIN